MKTLVRSLSVFLLLALITGVAYPLAMSGLAALLFPEKATGSQIQNTAGVVTGSGLLAQEFKSPGYFWPRPSAASFATIASGASNAGPTSAGLRQAITDRAATLRTAHELLPDAPVPPELLQASGSGLDPHISPEAARFQMERVAKARGFTPEQSERVRTLIAELTEPPQLGFLGQARVNVLLLNLRLDALP